MLLSNDNWLSIFVQDVETACGHAPVVPHVLLLTHFSNDRETVNCMDDLVELSNQFLVEVDVVGRGFTDKLVSNDLRVRETADRCLPRVGRTGLTYISGL